eukprot:CAMPEP_0202859398 /NCGR_PEP_ID=MMETSP1391-20130828/1528_1 /ASSEMBLY_ACC=CAM_ASM_000867 /TAXON_ID=1034604 /ORGANISM="Chlamydomonas leiostraca, Strain SAG 11-49" /LENGTH=259 /DNA_ID=CAMNT_0049538429 /DNA_START=74 /DNA_END=853 /DNA_ORIENTATION=-
MSLLALASLLAFAQLSVALEFALDHSLDGGKTWSPAGVIEGDSETLQLIMNTHSEDVKSKLKALAKADGFYLLRVGGSVTSVRAACFTTPASNIGADMWLSGREPAGFALSYDSEGCGSAPAGAALHPLSGKHPVVVHHSVLGPTLNAVDVDVFGGAGSINLGVPGSGASGGKRGATNRPVGVVPGSQQAAAGGQGGQGGQGEQQPPPEQSWWQKNWLFVVGGAMVVMNMMSSAARNAPGAAGAGAAAGGAPAGAARRG